MPQLMRRSSSYLFFSGAIAILFGLIASLSPISTVLTLVVIWGIYALADGVMALAASFRPENRGARMYLNITGIIGILAGLFAIFHPISGAATLTWVMGIWFIVRGMFDLMAAIGGHAATSRGSLALAGIAWIFAGLLFCMNPGHAILAISVWLGVLAIAWGILLIAGGFFVRSSARDARF